MDTFMFLSIAYHAVVKARLPFKGNAIQAGEFGYANLVPAHNGCKVLRLRSETVFGLIW